MWEDGSRRQEKGYSEFKILLAFQKKFYYLRDCLDHFHDQVSWQIISDTDSACGKTAGIACWLQDKWNTVLHWNGSFFHFPSQLLLNPNGSPKYHTIKPVYFPGKSFPSQKCSNMTLLCCFKKKRQWEWNFIEHSKLNMACWLAVWTLLSLLAPHHYVSASRWDDTWRITFEE